MATKTRLQVAAELLGQGRLAEAKSRLLKEVRLAPQSAPALDLLGVVLFEMGHPDEAIRHLRQAVRFGSASPGPHLNLGRALLKAQCTDEALVVLADAVARWPTIHEGHLIFGNALQAKGEKARAIEEYQAAIAIAPKATAAYLNLAILLSDMDQHEAVCEVCERLLGIDPACAAGAVLLARSRQMLCAWDGQDGRLAGFAKAVEQGYFESSMPFTSMLLWDSASMHRRCADLGVRHYLASNKAIPTPRLAVRKEGRIRVAYVSADYCRHPITYLIAGMLEKHDRDRFEIVGVSIGKDDGSAERRRVEAAFDRFVDAQAMASTAVVQAMRDMQIDIAVDLMGYTTDYRPGIFHRRAAPIQVSYLGFPGTTAISAMDYLVVDPFIAAGDIAGTASEALAILPHCYQCNDDAPAPPPAMAPSRASCGLPENAFVFCSFNGTQKLAPDVFDVWMRILRQVEGSVLWLRQPPSKTAEANLIAEAGRRGISSDRLVFAERVPNQLHIARNALADLHLDTLPYNAHTTASDALRVGRPIVTRAGLSFPARVCGSLLTTIGVPELITHSPEEYEALAVRLARDKAMLSGLQQRIEHGRDHSPLFNTALFCRHMERAYTAMVERHRSGRPRAQIDVRTLIADHPD